MKSLDKIIKDAITAKKCKTGTREVVKSIKGSKLIILTKSIPSTMKSKIISEATDAAIPFLTYDGSSMAFGRICNKPFRVSAISLKIGDDDDIRNIVSTNKGA